MSERALTPLERLARRICWLEFTPPRSKKRLGYTEAGYWRAISADSRKERIQDAERLLWILSALDEHASSCSILDKALPHD